LLGVQTWGITTTFWMGALIWKVGSISAVKDNPFAALLAIQISPGAGLYLGLIGGLVVAAALGFAAVHRLLSAGSLKPFYVTQGCSCALGILLAFYVGPDQPAQSKDTSTANLLL